eukprot:283134-Prorocentrum_lima.AAC.1
MGGLPVTRPKSASPPKGPPTRSLPAPQRLSRSQAPTSRNPFDAVDQQMLRQKSPPPCCSDNCSHRGPHWSALR